MNYFLKELPRQNEEDHNIKYFPDDYHEYPVEIQAIKSDWMFRNQNVSMSHSEMKFLKEIYDS